MKISEITCGNIVGIIDAYGAVHSEFTGQKMRFHEEFWPQKNGCRWRWNWDKSIWWITAESKPDEDEFSAIVRHLTRKYRIPFWSNGHHDINKMMALAAKEK